MFQIVSASFIQHVSWPMVFLLAYCIGGVINHALLLSIHEISHNVIFGNARPLANRLFGMFVNLPIGVPCSSSFKRYHSGEIKLTTTTTLPHLNHYMLFSAEWPNLTGGYALVKRSSRLPPGHMGELPLTGVKTEKMPHSIVTLFVNRHKV